MKKFFSLMVACAAMFAFAACENGTDDTNNGGTNNGGNKTALATPVLKIDEAQSTSSSFVVTWDAVENAASYMVNNGSENKTITETSFKMENLNAGTYTVKVMAMAAADSNYSNSEFATITYTATGATIDEVDWATFVAGVPTEEDAELGYYPFVHVFVGFKGTGITEVKYGLFSTETYGDTPVATLISDCATISTQYTQVYEQINSENGYTLVFECTDEKGQVTGNGASFRAVAQIKNDKGVTVIADKVVTTSEGTVHPELDKWAGKWTVETTESIDIYEITEGDYKGYLDLKVGTTAITKTIEITPFTEMGWNALMITGLSSTDSLLWTDSETGELVGSTPALAELGENNYLQLMTEITGTTVQYADGTSAPAVWTALLKASDPKYGIFDFAINDYAYAIGMEEGGNKALTKERTKITLVNNQTKEEVPCQVYGYEVLGYNTDNTTFFFIDTEKLPISYAAGDMTFTRLSEDVNNTPTPESFSASAPKAVNATKAMSVKHNFLVK